MRGHLAEQQSPTPYTAKNYFSRTLTVDSEADSCVEMVASWFASSALTAVICDVSWVCIVNLEGG